MSFDLKTEKQLYEALADAQQKLNFANYTDDEAVRRREKREASEVKAAVIKELDRRKGA